MGLPTILLLPTTTHSFPAISIPERFSSCMTPAGVQDTKPGLPMQSAPTFWGWNPSTSFKGEMESSTFSSSICFGNGSCTRMPLTSVLSFNSRISSSNFFSVVSSGSSYARDRIPTYSQAFFLLRTYTEDAGSAPTWITASVTSQPCSFNPATFSLTSSLICAEITFPSINCAMRHFPPY